MDRKALKIPFSGGRPPDWVCPTCTKGILRLVPEAFKKEERLHSRDHSHDAWEPEWMEYTYSSLLVCSNESCREVVAMCGTGSVDYFQGEDEHGQWIEVAEDNFKPKFFEPHLRLFSIPAKCPDSISEPLNESFRLFFASPGAASNCVRIAIEELLNDLKIKRFNVVKGKRRFIPLHQRITLLPDKHAELKEILTAIKWLGNAGSHPGNTITSDDVMDAYEFTEHVLNEIYAPRRKTLAAMAKKVNKRKGPKK